MTDQTQTPAQPETAAPAAAPAEAPAPAAKLGIDELKKVVDLAMGLVRIGEQVVHDGKVNLSDLPLLIKLVPLVVPMAAGAKQLPAELADLDGGEEAELVGYVIASLTVEGDKAKAIVAASLKLAADAYELVKAIKA